MPSTIQLYKTKDFVRTTQTGAIDLERSLEVVRNLAKISQYPSDFNILLDVRGVESEPLSANELMVIASEFVKHRSAFRNKIAVLLPDEERRMANARYFKNCMALEGFQLEAYTKYEDAIDWLSLVKDMQTVSSAT